ncbi:hypothetical protein [Paenibacillus pinistramenti]|uniref:hypothetical protein n=1 Tax=Paenibacillus pinistramenti TaxID=1768003 RepID=UPI001396CCA9|nr:hypothetical protein [Paenibacillus pinistramenti]
MITMIWLIGPSNQISKQSRMQEVKKAIDYCASFNHHAITRLYQRTRLLPIALRHMFGYSGTYRQWTMCPFIYFKVRAVLGGCRAGVFVQGAGEREFG